MVNILHEFRQHDHQMDTNLSKLARIFDWFFFLLSKQKKKSIQIVQILARSAGAAEYTDCFSTEG